MTWNEIRTYINNWITQNISKSNRGDKLNNSLTYICNETETHTLDTNIHITALERINWDTAYGWGDHSTEGYLKTLSFLGLTDTPAVYTGEGGKGVRVKATVDGLEFYTIVDKDEKVKYDALDPTAGYVADKVIAGSGISVTEGIGADENKLVITNTDKGSSVVVPVNADFTLAGLGEKSYSSLTDIPSSFHPTTHGNGSHSTDLVGEPGIIDAKDAKTTPVDADVMILEDSEDLAVGLKKPKKITWANIKATLKIYFDTLYETAGALAGHLLAYTHGDIAHTNRIDLDLVSGNNTGDQDLSGLALKTGNLLITYTENDLGNSGAAKTVPFDTHNYHKITLTADCTLTITAPSGSICARFQIRVSQDGTGGWDLIFPTGVNGVVFSQGAFDFTAGTAGQYCIVTIDWNGTFYTANVTDWADVPS